MNQRGLAPLVVIFIVILIISVGAYFLSKPLYPINSQTQTTNNEQVQNQSSSLPTSNTSPQSANSSFSGGSKIKVIRIGPHNTLGVPLEVQNTPEDQLIAFKCSRGTKYDDGVYKLLPEGKMSTTETEKADQNLINTFKKLEQDHNTDNFGYIEYCIAQNSTSFINYSIRSMNYSSLISRDNNIIATVKIDRDTSAGDIPCAETIAYKSPSTIFVNCNKYSGNYKIKFSDNSSSKVE